MAVEHAGVNHVEAAGGVGAGDDVALEGLEAGGVARAPREVEVEAAAQEAFGHAGEAVERVLDAAAEEAPAEEVVVDGDAGRVFDTSCAG